MEFVWDSPILYIGQVEQRQITREETEDKRKDFSTALLLLNRKSFISELSKVTQEKNVVDPSLHDNVLTHDNFFEYIYVGCYFNTQSIIESGLIAGGRNASQDRQAVFFTAVHPLATHCHKQKEFAVTEPRVHQDALYWIDIRLAHKKGLKFFQTRSNATTLNDTLPPVCIERGQ